MKRAVSLLASLMVVAAIGLAQEKKMEEKKEAAAAKEEGKSVTMKGYVVDAMCAKGIAKKENMMEKAAAHTKECALEEACSATGYGLFSEGKWFKFDDAGDKQAKAMIEKSKAEKGLAFEVTGKLEGDKFAVASLKETKIAKEVKKKTESKEN
jgi:hypothetical protein